MRALSPSLLAAQRAASMTPYIRVTVTDGVTPYYFDTHAYAGYTERLLSVEGYEEPFGGAYTIRLRNNDQYFADKSLEGFTVTITWGAKTSPTTYGAADQAPLFVISQRDVSYEGELATELFCLDYWWQAAAKILYKAGARLDGVVTNGGLFEPGETITGSVSGAIGRLIGLDGEGITVTTVSGTFQTAENAVGASGASVAALTAVTAIPIAGGVSYGKQSTILEIITAEKPAKITGVDLDSDDPLATINTVKPELVLPIGTDSRSLIRHLLQMSSCGARIENDSHLHILYLDNAAGSDYIYQTTHVFWSQLREQALIIPNKVTFVDVLPAADGSVPAYSGSAEDSGSVALIGTFETIQVDPTITTGAMAVLKATAWIAQRLAEANQGGVRAPMNCGQELYDMVTVVDARSGVSVKGRVGRIDRVYRAGSKGTPGVYEISIRLGGIMSDLNTGYLGPGTLDANLKGLSTDTLDPLKLPTLTPGWSIPVGQQSYIADINFTSVDYNHISWTAGTVKWADGRTQAVTTVGSPLLLTATHYLYVIYGNSTLQSSTTYSDAIGNNRVLVGVSSIGSSSAVKAYVLNPHTDSILINRDKVMDNLVNDLKLASNAVTEAKIAASAVTSGKLAAGSVIAGKIAALSIAAGDIAAGAIVADKIAAGAVTAIKINVATLDAISANVGTLTGGTINGVTITAGAGNVVIDTNGITCKANNALRIYNGAAYYGRLLVILNTFGFYGEVNIGFYIQTLGTGPVLIAADAAGVTLDAGTDVTVNSGLDIILNAGDDIILQAGDYIELWSVGAIYMDRSPYMDIPRRATAPTAVGGRVYMNTTDNVCYIYDVSRTAWRDLGF